MPSGSAPCGKEEESVADQLASLAVTDGADEADSAEATRKAEDPELWKPHPPNEDCPICFVPLPLLGAHRTYNACCGKRICNACDLEDSRALNVANAKKAKKELQLLPACCPFCRSPTVYDPHEGEALYSKRICQGDANAAFNLGHFYRYGFHGFPKDEEKGLELFRRAAAMGSSTAIIELGIMSLGIIGSPMGQTYDEEKGRAFMEKALLLGEIDARFYLGIIEDINGNTDIAIRHWKLAAEAGHTFCMGRLWKCFSEGKLSKDDLEQVLRAHQTALDGMNSEERERYLAYDEGEDKLLSAFIQRYYNGEMNAKELEKNLKRNGYVNYKKVK